MTYSADDVETILLTAMNQEFWDDRLFSDAFDLEKLAQALAAAEAKGRADRLRTEADVRVTDAPTPTVGDDLDLLTARLKSANAGATNAPLGYVEDMHEAATALTTLRERVARLEGLLRELEDTLTPAEQVPPKDPAYGEEVRALGLRIGFGALMASASHEWRQWLADNGYPLGSEFVAGPCRAVLESDLCRARTAIGE